MSNVIRAGSIHLVLNIRRVSREVGKAKYSGAPVLSAFIVYELACGLDPFAMLDDDSAIFDHARFARLVSERLGCSACARVAP